MSPERKIRLANDPRHQVFLKGGDYDILVGEYLADQISSVVQLVQSRIVELNVNIGNYKKLQISKERAWLHMVKPIHGMNGLTVQFTGHDGYRTTAHYKLDDWYYNAIDHQAWPNNDFIKRLEAI